MNRIEQLRSLLAQGRSATQERLAAVLAELDPARATLRPRDRDEALPLCSEFGEDLGLEAPRWLCHLLGLRHRCAHLLLSWQHPHMEEVLVLQIRNWDKADSPGHVDISVGGHVTVADASAEVALLAELRQELGLTVDDLEGPLKRLGGYAFDEVRPEENFFNSEWRDLFLATLKPDRMGAIQFRDGEVGGLVLVPLVEASKLLEQTTMPMASALRESLPILLSQERGM